MATNNSLNAPLPLGLTQGGHGATTASGARTNLGLAIGSDVQAYSGYLATIVNGFFPNFRNKLINGDMRISQRGSVFTSVTNGQYTLDRWLHRKSGTGVVTIQQTTDSPSGSNVPTCLEVVVTTADGSGSTSRYYTVSQYIEGYNYAPIAGSAMKLTFNVKSSQTGTYYAVIQDTSSTATFITGFSISVANTWESKTLTVSAPTTGTFSTTTGIGLKLNIVLSSGSSTQGGSLNTWLSGDFIGGFSGQANFMSAGGASFRLHNAQLE